MRRLFSRKGYKNLKLKEIKKVASINICCGVDKMTRTLQISSLVALLLIVAGSPSESKDVNKRHVVWTSLHPISYYGISNNGTAFATPYQYQQNFVSSYPFQGWPFAPISTFPSASAPAAVTQSPAILQDIAHDVNKHATSCGSALFYSFSRIVDGENAQYGEFPWLVAIMRDDGHSHLCGGSLISSNYILTAAHCFKSYSSDDVHRLRVFVGDYNIYDARDVSHQVRSVSRLIRHRQWNSPAANFNDVALLKLDRPVQLSTYVQPVCLPTSQGTAEFYNSGSYATVAGWGAVRYGNPSRQSTPLKVQVPLVDQYTCQNSIQPHRIGDSMICAGVGYKSACLGDSGGPLTVMKNGRWYQIGIVSWGIECGGYGVFTKVSSFRQWIDKHSAA